MGELVEHRHQDFAGRASGDHPDAALVDDLRTRVLSALAPIAPREPYALLDYPWYPNVGDQALWLGTLAALRSLGCAPPAYVASVRTYCPRALRRRIGNGPILLHSGGNLGDVWPVHQRHRETVLRNHPDNPITQLPQSVQFTHEETRERARGVFASHPRFVLMVRDRRSCDRARDELGVEPLLCPDMALCLPPPQAPASPTVPTRLLIRGDIESAAARLDAYAGIEPEDWAGWPGPVEARLQERLRQVMVRVRPPQPVMRRYWEALATRRLRHGERLLRSARMVVTDRLHGHILCVLYGVPHVVIDDRYGKISSFHRTWTQRSRLTQWLRKPAAGPAGHESCAA